MNILRATLFGWIVGLAGTLPGGTLVLYTGNGVMRQSLLLGFSGGIMIAVVIFDLWWEAWRYGGFWLTLFGNLLGVMLIAFAEAGLNRGSPKYESTSDAVGVQLGLLLGLGIACHNFPEGVALGTTYGVSREAREWMGLAFLMALHNFPEGMVITSALRLGKIGWKLILVILIMTELPMAVGSGIGAWLSNLSTAFIGISLGFAGGAMLFLVLADLLPIARKLAGAFGVCVGFCTGFLLGIVLVKITG